MLTRIGGVCVSRHHHYHHQREGELSREAVYIEKHDALLLLGGRKLLVMDCESNRWRVIDTEMPEKAYGWDAAMVYNPVHDVVVALLPPRFSGPMRVFLFRYDPKTAEYKGVTQ